MEGEEKETSVHAFLIKPSDASRSVTFLSGMKVSMISPVEKFITNACTGTVSPGYGFPLTANSRPPAKTHLFSRDLFGAYSLPFYYNPVLSTTMLTQEPVSGLFASMQQLM